MAPMENEAFKYLRPRTRIYRITTIESSFLLDPYTDVSIKFELVCAVNDNIYIVNNSK